MAEMLTPSFIDGLKSSLKELVNGSMIRALILQDRLQIRSVLLDEGFASNSTELVVEEFHDGERLGVSCKALAPIWAGSAPDQVPDLELNAGIGIVMRLQEGWEPHTVMASITIYRSSHIGRPVAQGSAQVEVLAKHLYPNTTGVCNFATTDELLKTLTKQVMEQEGAATVAQRLDSYREMVKSFTGVVAP